MDVERARQVEHGYDDAHDAEKGIAHLLNWAIDYARRGNNLAAATMVRCALRLERGPVTEPCEWCPEQHTGFAEWQGDGLAHPSCAREGHGSNFEPVREPVTDAQVESAAEKFAASILVPEREARLAQSAFTAGVEWRERAARDARS